jgi:serine/threonine protein kinase
MSPVADCDLRAFYDIAATDDAHLRTLRTFYGCLTAALIYLHSSKIRHRDIKPQNILVKAERVYLADFGISLDWESLSRSTTTEDSAKTLLYCAPEVAQFKPRNSSSDI